MESDQLITLARAIYQVNLPKKKILWVGAFPPDGADIFGGVIVACRSLLKSNFSKEFDLSLIDSTQKSNPAPRFLVRAFYAFLRHIKFIRKLRYFKPDAILIFCSSGFGLAEKGLLAWYSKLCGIPCVMFPRGGGLLAKAPTSFFWRWHAKTFLNSAAIILCQGSAWQKFAVDVLEFRKEKTIIINNWISNSKYFEIGEQRADIQVRTNLAILFVGWVEKEKGVFELIEACKLIAKSYDFTVTIVGEGTALDDLVYRVKKYGLMDRFNFLGWIKGETLLEVYKLADIFVLPSHMEGFPNVILEAMASRLPIITTPVGNISDIVKDGHTGIFVPPKDVIKLAQSLESLFVSGPTRKLLADNGYEVARKTFEIDIAVKKMTYVFHGLIDKSIGQ